MQIEPNVERRGTPEEIAAADAAWRAAKAQWDEAGRPKGEPAKVWRRLLFQFGLLCRRKHPGPRPKKSPVDERIARVVATEREVKRGKLKLEEAIHRGKTEMFVTDTLAFLREQVIPRLTQRMNRPKCEGCGFQQDHKEERWALDAGVELGNKILDIYARTAGPLKDGGGKRILKVAEWPSEGAKS